MRTQRRNTGDNYWNRQVDRGLFMESPTHSKLFPNDSSSSMMMQPSLPTSSGVGGSCVGDGGLGYIEHTVTKFDTLAGVAIKYGVEVADIKRMNGLTTDLQMYARNTVHIPLPGRHPPSPILVNGHGPKKSEMTPPRQRHSDMLHSIKSLKLSSSPRSISPSMDALRDYYGLKPTDQTGPKSPQSSHPPVGLHRKCKSLANGMSERGVVDAGINGGIPVANGIHDSDTWYDRWMRRRRSEIDLQNQTPEMMLKPDTSNTSSAFSTAGGKGLALRPKASSRTVGDADGLPNMPPLKLGESVITEASGGVKKSSSSPSFHDMHSNGSSMSIWPTSMLNLTADLQASTAAITRPIFDGLPKPISGRKKAAID